MSLTTRATARPLRPRHWLLAASLGATVAACLWAAQLPTDDAADLDLARPRRAAPASQASQARGEAAVPRWSAPAREAWPDPGAVALAAWQPPAPVPTPAVMAPMTAPASLPPQAPAFPYQLIGRLVEAGRTQALLGAEQRSLAVQVGDTIDGQWRVQAIGDESLELLWLPGPLPQTLRFKPL